MANSKVYQIKINGVEQSISRLDALVAKAEELSRKLAQGITVDVQPQVQQPQQANTAQTQQAEKTFQIQSEITVEIEKQNAALQQQTSIVSSQSSSYKDALDVATSILGTYDDNIAKLAEYDSKLKEIAAQKKAVQDIGVENEQTRAIMQELLADEIKYKQLKSETASILKTETKLLQAEEGSYDQMSAAVGRLRDALRASNGNLSPEQFNAISQAVSTLDQELKDADKGMGNFFRNVGNYQSAAEGFNKIKVEIAGTVQEFDGAKTAIMSLKNAMAQLAVEGKTDTEEYKALADQMRDLQLAMVTVNDEIERSKDASSGLHDTIEMVQGFAAIGEIGQGFSQLFGMDDSAITEQIRKMTTLMGILQGLNELKNQIATGTGIGPVLKKVFDVTGLSSSMKELGENVKLLAQKLGLVPPAAEAGAVGMTTFAVATRVATSAVKAFWRALIVGLIIEAVVWLIEGLVDGIKALYNIIHDYISVADDAEAANKALAHSYELVSQQIDNYNEVRDHEVARGEITKEIADMEKMLNIQQQLAKYAGVTEGAFVLNAENADITPVLHQYDEFEQRLQSINEKNEQGLKIGSDMDALYKDVLADLAARWLEVDKNDQKAIEGFMEWYKQAPLYQAAVKWAIDTGDDSMKQFANTINDAFNNVSSLINQFYNLKAAVDSATASLRQELELREKYGDNWRTEDKVLKDNKEIDQSNLSESQKSRLKALREKETRAQNKAHAAAGRQRVASSKRTGNDLLNIERQIQQDKLAIMRDGLTKTLATIEDERRRRIDAAKKMAVSEEKRNEAIAAINARYDKEALDARKKYHEDYLKAEEEFVEKLTKLNSDVRQTEIETDKIQSGNFFEAAKNRNDRNTFEDLFKQVGYKEDDENGVAVLNFYKSYAEEWKKVHEKYDEIFDKRRELDKKLRSLEGEILFPEITSERTKEINKEIASINIELSKLAKEEEELDSSFTEIINKRYKAEDEIRNMEANGEKLSMDSAHERFNVWMMHFTQLNSLQKDEYKRQFKLQKEANDEQTKADIYALELQAKAEIEALSKRRNAWVDDMKERYDVEVNGLDDIIKIEKEKYMEMYNNSDKYKNDELQKQYDFYVDLLTKKETFEKDIYDIGLAYRMKESELNAQNMQRNTELENQYNENIRKQNADTYSQFINEFNKYASDIEKRQAKLKDKNTDAWGFFNIKQFREDKNKILSEYDTFVIMLNGKMTELRNALSLGLIDPLDFTQSYGELNDLMEKIKETMKELNADNGLEDFMKGVDEWIQQIGQAANQILSAVFDYRNSEFERMREELDKQIELVQEKYDEMEELAQRHKDAMNEIEDELTTARGDRRQHLIDALSTEIDAQRRALAEQKKAEKEKKKLEADGDKLELQRKKEQKRQSLITAVINAALAISQAAANKWPVPAIPLMALAAATGAAQVAAISAQKYAKGGLLQGPSHERGGIKVGGGIEVEGGEFVTNRRTTAQNLDLLYYINSSRKRLNVDDFVEFFSKGGGSKPLLGAKGKFEDGGLTPSLEIASRVAEVVVAQDDRPVVVSVVDINDAQARVRRVQAMAGLER